MNRPSGLNRGARPSAVSSRVSNSSPVVSAIGSRKLAARRVQHLDVAGQRRDVVAALPRVVRRVERYLRRRRRGDGVHRSGERGDRTTASSVTWNHLHRRIQDRLPPSGPTHTSPTVLPTADTYVLSRRGARPFIPRRCGDPAERHLRPAHEILRLIGAAGAGVDGVLRIRTERARARDRRAGALLRDHPLRRLAAFSTQPSIAAAQSTLSGPAPPPQCRTPGIMNMRTYSSIFGSRAFTSRST